MERACASSVTSIFESFAAAPSRPISFASNGMRGPAAPAAGASSAVIDQYSSGLNALISRSRSTMIRRATDCTRPADSPRRTFSQRMGLIL